MSLELFSAVGALVCLLLVALYRFLVAPYDFFDKRGMSGPRPALVFGTWWGMWNKFQGEEDLRRVKQYGGEFGTFDGRTPNLVVTDPTLVRAVLADKAANFRSRRAYCVRDQFLQQGLLALEARESQGLNDTRVVLTQDNIKKLVPRISQSVTSLTEQVKKTADASEGSIIVNDLLSNFLGCVLAAGMFGQESSAQEKVINVKEFSHFLNEAFLNDNPDSPLAAMPFIYPSLVPLDKFVLRSKAAKYFTSLLLTKLQERIRAQKVDEDKLLDLIDILLQSQQRSKSESEDQNKEEENTIQIRDFVLVQCLSVLLNTSLMTRTVTSLAVSMLAAKPELQERLHDELYKQMQSTNEYDLVYNSEFLDMFLSEILRLYPIEFRLERECCETLELEKIKIEKGTVVSVPVYALHRQYQLYPEPEAFNPERFSREHKEKRDPFTYLPYGQAGDSAANISIQWSLLVAKLAVAGLIKKFKFLPGENTTIPPAFQMGVTGIPRLQPLTIGIESRQ